MSRLIDRTRAVLDRALAACAADKAATAVLAAHRARLDGPLRVALAGTMKSGKSTLLNALVGEQIAPTGTGECTRVVTTYAGSPLARIVVEHRGGPAGRPPDRELPVVHRRGQLVVDLAGTPVEQVRRLRVQWPARDLAATTLVDTPGVDSTRPGVAGRARAFLDPGDPTDADDPDAGADVVLHLVRHLHDADVAFAETVGDRAAAGIGPAGTVAVLSRADEVGGGRLDALMAAQQVARRYRTDPALRPHCRTVVAVAGLLAETARTLRGAEYAALRDLAAGSRAEVDDLLLSGDRFVGGALPAGVVADRLDPRARRALLDRFGVFGVRLATTLLRRGGSSGAADSATLAAELLRRSGFDELREVVQTRLVAQGDVFRARAALLAVDRVVRARPRGVSDDAVAALAGEVERVLTGAHEFVEQAVLVALRARPGDAGRAEVEEAQRLLGGDGPGAATRLGLPPDAGPDDRRAAALDVLARWRRRGEDPMGERAAVELARAVVRSVEGVLVGASGM